MDKLGIDETEGVIDGAAEGESWLPHSTEIEAMSKHCADPAMAFLSLLGLGGEGHSPIPLPLPLLFPIFELLLFSEPTSDSRGKITIVHVSVMEPPAQSLPETSIS